MLCDLQPAEPGVQVCKVCQRPFAAAHDVKVRRRCQMLLAGIAKPDPAVRHCVHLGEPAGFRDCPSCRGTVKQKTFACLNGYGEVTLAECRTCQDYKAFGPTKITRVPLPDYCFNASIFDQFGSLRLCWRQKPRGSTLWIGDLDENYAVSNAAQLDVQHPLCRSGREDPRVFWYRGRVHVGFCGVESVAGGIVAHQLLARLDEAGAATEEVWCPDYPERAAWEKNWMWFDHEGELHCVYTIKPHAVLAEGRKSLVKIFETDWHPRWSGGHLRGGASPVRVGDEYWSFFHGTLDQPGMPRRIYALGLYCFEAKPPFRPTRHTPEPLLWPDEATRPAGLAVSVVFPCGAVKRGNNWLVSMGVHDRWIDVAEFSHAGIEKVMVKA